MVSVRVYEKDIKSIVDVEIMANAHILACATSCGEAGCTQADPCFKKDTAFCSCISPTSEVANLTERDTNMLVVFNVCFSTSFFNHILYETGGSIEITSSNTWKLLYLL